MAKSKKVAAKKAPKKPPAKAAKPKKVSPVPAGYHTVIPHLVVKGAMEALEFYKKAFGAKVHMCMPGKDGKTVLHAEMKIGGSHVFLCDEFPEMGVRGPASIGGSPVSIHLYVNDCDAVFNAAVAAGAAVLMPLMDMFWGDRYGKLCDPFGQHWSVATHKEDLTPAQIDKRRAECGM